MLALLALLALQADPDTQANRAASRRGSDFLMAQAPGLKEKPDLAELVLWALVRADVYHPLLKTQVADVLSRPPSGTRSAALQALALAEIDPWGRYRSRIAYCLQLLIDQQAGDGLWGAGGPGDPPPPLPPEAPPRKGVEFGKAKPIPPILNLSARAGGPATGDLEHAAWAVEALVAGRQARIAAPEETLDRAAEAWTGKEPPPAPALASRATLLLLRGRHWKEDAVALAALARLEQAPFPSAARELQALHTALRRIGRDRLGERDGYREGAAALRKAQQPDGSWGDLETTVRAVVFLGPDHGFRQHPNPTPR
jgi:hypothetical protein